MAELVIQPSAKDNTPSEYWPTTNYGAASIIYLMDGATETRRAILEFDLSDIPGGQTIVSANLQLYFRGFAHTNPSGKTVWAYKLTRIDWVEAQSTWNVYKSGSNWTNPGGDYVTSNPAGDSIVFPASPGWISFDVLAIVQDAYGEDNPAEFLVKFATEQLASGFSQVELWSNNYSTDTSLRPKLVIEYEPTYTTHEKTLTDGIEINEALVKNPIKLLSDGVALSDVLVKNPIKVLADGIAFTDTLISYKLMIKVLSDGIAFTDMLIRTFVRVFTDGIKFHDFLLKWRWLSPVRRLLPFRLLQPHREEEARE